jgi:glycosyltransferase involved in cell wall biosynthesis
LSPLGCPIVVVDSGSTDRTREIAGEFGAVVLEHPFVSHSQQWAWALDNLPVKTNWVLALDADQVITPELAKEIAAKLPESTFDGLYIRRQQIFRGRWIRHGGYYPKYLLKLFRREKVNLHFGDAVDHHFYIRGSCGKLHHDLIESNRKEDDISFWVEKHNRYAALMALEEYRRGEDARPISPSPFGTPDQRVAWLKQVWSHMPLYIRPGLYFAYRYILRGGFLDGKEGFVFHFLQAFWYRLLIDIKLEEIRKMAKAAADVQSETTQN